MVALYDTSHRAGGDRSPGSYSTQRLTLCIVNRYSDSCADVVRNVLNGCVLLPLVLPPCLIASLPHCLLASSLSCGRYNGCILAYGQTGTGKTHTMGILQRIDAGRAGHSCGVIPSAMQHLWDEMEVS